MTFTSLSNFTNDPQRRTLYVGARRFANSPGLCTATGGDDGGNPASYTVTVPGR